jgi:hypothetical protein
MMVLPGEVLRPRNRATGMGVFYTWYYAGMALLTPAAGVLRDASGRVRACGSRCLSRVSTMPTPFQDSILRFADFDRIRCERDESTDSR